MALHRASDNSLVDVIGQIGTDPGTVWGTGDNTTAEHTLVRMDTIKSGDAIGNDAFNPADEWVSYPQNTFTYIGSHTTDWGIEIDASETATATSVLITNSNSTDTSSMGFVYDGIIMAYSAENGTMTPPTDGTESGVTSSVYTPSYVGMNDICVTLDNEEICNIVSVISSTDITTLELLGSLYGSSWSAVYGDIDGGYTYGLDPALAFQFLDAGTYTVTRTLEDGYYGFFLDETSVPAGFLAYWDAKGVNASATVGTW